MRTQHALIALFCITIATGVSAAGMGKGQNNKMNSGMQQPEFTDIDQNGDGQKTSTSCCHKYA